MSINRWMDKEDVVHIYNEILLSHKKEWNGVGWGNVDEPRACHTEWSVSGREKQILYTSKYIWLTCEVLKKDTNEFIYKTEVDSQTYKLNFWLPKGKGGELNLKFEINRCRVLPIK